MGTKTSRNFITTNAVNTIMSVPRKPQSKYVDTPKGAQHLVEVILIITLTDYYIILSCIIYRSLDLSLNIPRKR